MPPATAGLCVPPVPGFLTGGFSPDGFAGAETADFADPSAAGTPPAAALRVSLDPAGRTAGAADTCIGATGARLVRESG
ncbi:MAG: hypothetical protein KDA79_02115 [Planctomycetaceae bacterium]|nr:hypothetical protein [Planctomycetaceae bacterium]